MNKKKVQRRDLEIKSFVTVLNRSVQAALKGGDDIPPKNSRLPPCPSNQDPSACNLTEGDECEGMITDDLRECGEMLS